MADNFGDGLLDGSAELAENLSKVAAKSREIVSEYLKYQADQGLKLDFDPMNISQAFFELTQKMMTDPGRMFEAQTQLWARYAELWQNAAERGLSGQPTAPVIEPEKGDKRFKDKDWQDNQVFDLIKQGYLLTADWLTKTVHDVEGLDPKTQHKVDFYTKQFVDAMSPSNFVLTNPEVLRTTIETKGENLVRGLQHVLEDLQRGKGELQIAATDFDAFELGVNVATTPGEVVHQNDVMQLIQYAPATEQVYEIPLLIMPPWINKFYILDLQPANSFIKWATEQGYTVFVISWVNPDEKLAEKTFSDYMFEGPLDALDAIERATGKRKASVIGYCIGGTLLASTLAYMAEKGDDGFAAATFFTAQVDFSEAGDLCVFIDEEQLHMLDERMAERGYLDGSKMMTTFSMLRSRDLIWSFVINNYLLGKDPFPFDLLYWNADATRMPKALHSFYLRQFYLNNKLVEPGGITLGGIPLDIRKVKTPTYIQAGKEDHIAPANSVYKMTQYFSGPMKFMLAGSGHIAGVVNPPAAEKYMYWTKPGKPPKDFTAWFDGAKETKGSWWPDWHSWLSKKSGKKVPARMPGDGALKPIEKAPGSYVLVQSNPK